MNLDANVSTFLGKTIGEYLLVEYIGAGGMGEIYRGVHSKIGRVVAVKIIKGVSPHSSMNQRFLNEARIQSRLHHPNIVTLYDFVEFEGYPCIIMEFVPGQTLAEQIQSTGGVPKLKALRLFQSILEAVKFMHQNGIVHRDIKPANIKVTEEGKVKLLDFGIAKTADTPDLTVTGYFVGTLQYSSPEQLSGESSDHRSDIWSLGVLLYEMITGQLPFEAASLTELLRKLKLGSYRAPSLMRSDIPPALDDLLKSCLAAKPRARFSSVQALSGATANVVDSISTTNAYNERSGKLPALSEWIQGYWPAIAACVAASVVVFAMLILFSGSSSTTAISAVPSPGQDATATDRLVPVSLDVIGEPATVYINGKNLGKSPYKGEWPARHEIDIKFVRPGYKDFTRTITVSEPRSSFTYVMESEKQP